MDIFKEVGNVLAGVVMVVTIALIVGVLVSFAATVPGPWSSVVLLTEVVGLAAIGLLSLGGGLAIGAKMIESVGEI